MSGNKFLFFTTVILILAANISFSQNADYKFDKVVIDAGHGGKDPGATFSGIHEKDIVLDVALRTGTLLKKKCPEVAVVYIRDKDVFPELSYRAEKANKSKADLFISIHANSTKGKGVTGVETFILGLRRSNENLEVTKAENSVILLEEDYTTKYEGFDPNVAESYIMFEMMQNEYMEHSMIFAEAVQRNIISSTGQKDRGVKQEPLLVLRMTAMPSVLIEIGFMSTESERNFLLTDKAKDQMAKAIVDGIIEYKHRFDERTPSTASKGSKFDSGRTENKPKEKKDTIKGLVKAEADELAKVEVKDTIETEKKDSLIADIESLKGKWFGVQIMAAKEKYVYGDPMFKGQDSLYYLYEGGFHKFFTGLSRVPEETLRTNSQIKSLFPGAFPVAFIEGKKVAFSQAR
ncbi:MAG: N-acetylmuramoyl-L-alanine amidase [Prolixibacteraceae bacterium]|nr:N-acetylmuramoyl-L-alanine amidase [Prolixibacteraceae bacterium]